MLNSVDKHLLLIFVMETVLKKSEMTSPRKLRSRDIWSVFSTFEFNITGLRREQDICLLCRVYRLAAGAHPTSFTRRVPGACLPDGFCAVQQAYTSSADVLTKKLQNF